MNEDEITFNPLELFIKVLVTQGFKWIIIICTGFPDKEYKMLKVISMEGLLSPKGFTQNRKFLNKKSAEV